jgi:hypothetical protein
MNPPRPSAEEAALASRPDSSRAVLITRNNIKLDRMSEWDMWEVDKHMYDLVRGPGVKSSTMYKPADGAPQAIQANARRMVSYRAPDLDQMRLWLDSDVLVEAVADGRTWRDAYDPIEDQWFTGNVYRQTRAAGRDPRISSHLLIERFDVPATLAGAFDTWLASHFDDLAALEGVESVQSFAVVREIRNELYLSPANHAVQVTISAGQDPVARLTSAAAQKAFAGAQSWDFSLPYLKRELYTPAGHMFAPDAD